MERVLIIGTDPALIATRAEILKRHYHTRLANPGSTLDRLRADQFDLLLVCHSTPREEASAVIREVREEFPSLRIVRLLSAGEPPIENPIANRIVVVDYKPDSWIKAVEDLLSADLQA